MSLTKSNSNHLTLSLISKGILGGATGLLTKGIISDFIEIIITTKKGKKSGSSAGAIDKDYYKRFLREVEEDGDEIETILVKIKKKHLPKKYKISAELIRPQIEMELLEMQLYKDGNKPNINIELIDDTPNKITPHITTTLIDESNEEVDKTDIKIKLIKESFIYRQEKTLK
tara:strand:- start:46337 stop:46852 length:516 start_codon:yes stop_codon:yes gene_type:complete